MQYLNVENENGEVIENISEDTIGYIKYKNLGQNSSTMDTNSTNCITLIWDKDVETYAPDTNAWELSNITTDTTTTIYVGYISDASVDNNIMWYDYESSLGDRLFSRNTPLIIEVYYSKTNMDLLKNINISFNENFSASVLLDSNFYIVETETSALSDIYIQNISNYTLLDSQIKYYGNRTKEKVTVHTSSI